MRHKMGRIFVAAATACLMLLASACSNSKDPQSGVSGSAGANAEGGKGSYTDTYDPNALFKFGMTPVKDKNTGKYGYKNQSGQWVIEPQFMMANAFQVNQTAFVRTGFNKDQYRLIDRNGKFVSDYIFKRYADELEFAPNGIGVGKLCQADGTELGHGYFYLENGEIKFVKREESSLSGFSKNGYAVLDQKTLINDKFETILTAPEHVSITGESNGILNIVDTTKGVRYGHMDLQGKIMNQYPNSVSPFADNGIAVVDDKLMDKSGNVIFDVADSPYSDITSNFTKSDWVEVSKHGANRGGTDFNFVNAKGEYFFPTSAYERSHMDGKLAIKYGIYVGPAPVTKDEQGKITGIGGSGEYATVAVNEQMEILYIPSEKGIRDVSTYYSDGYALAENKDEQNVIVDKKGNIVMER